jgi:hypothetical protein
MALPKKTALRATARVNRGRPMLLANDTGRLFAVNGLKNSRAAAAGVCEIARFPNTAAPIGGGRLSRRYRIGMTMHNLPETISWATRNARGVTSLRPPTFGTEPFYFDEVCQLRRHKLRCILEAGSVPVPRGCSTRPPASIVVLCQFEGGALRRLDWEVRHGHRGVAARLRAAAIRYGLS